MYNAPIPQATHGYPIDLRLRDASRAQRGARRRFSILRALPARLRRPHTDESSARQR
jgi:hypothetical protein